MLSIERKQAILNYVKNKKIASVNELARYFKVHEVTIRRDLTTLEEEKKAKEDSRWRYDRRKNHLRTRISKARRSSI